MLLATIRRWMLLGLFVCGLLGLVHPSSRSHGQTSNDSLEGTWQIESMEAQGKRKMRGKDQLELGSMGFKDGKLVLRVQSDATIAEIKVNPQATPATMDVTMKIGGQKRTLPWIYKIDQDQMTICMNLKDSGERPKNFEPGDEQGVIVLKRISKEVVIPKIDSASDANNRVRSQNNMRLIGLALHNFHDNMGVLPAAAIVDKSGKPLLSWRVAILPYIEEEKLYREFKLDEPWDSEHNKKLIEKMPKIYQNPRLKDSKPGHTVYRVFTGKETMFELAKGKNLAQVTDGLSNTWMVVECSDEVIWTKPEELPYAANTPLPKLAARLGGRFSVLFGDGSIRTFQEANLKETVIRAMITANGGEVIPADGND